MREGVDEVSLDTWLEVLIQLIARLPTGRPQTDELLQDILRRVGEQHPQALVYPLTVASNSSREIRREAARGIMSDLRKLNSILVSEADLVSNELIRSAILWHEVWHEALDEASRFFFGENNIPAMLARVEPCHRLLEKLPPDATLREVAFYQAFGRDLSEAWEWLQCYHKVKDENALYQAWELYYQTFVRLGKMQVSLKELDMQHVAPKLMAAKSLQLAIPGTYTAGVTPIPIQSFDRVIKIMASKQKPRKIAIHGGDGVEYVFLLKGKEDLRQDERVMQVFSLVNTLLKTETRTKSLAITRYSVLPLSHNCGLVGWVQDTDTLHMLIKEYREARNIHLNVELGLMNHMAPTLDKLMPIQKLEVCQAALEKTRGTDIERMLWLKSQNAEVWLTRRTNYTRSLAVMSMMGYILGLGDRHPSNLMLEQRTGKIVHIDFGDCFEVAMEREKFPEKVPFRLTRMLVNAMEVSGIEGNFRSTAEVVMGVLRSNRDSVMAICEAFVHDPIIFMNLLTDNQAGGDEGQELEREQDQPSVPGQKAEKKGRGRASMYPHGRRNSVDPGMMLKMTNKLENREMASNTDDVAEPSVVSEKLNERALKVIRRVDSKLRGRDFGNTQIPVAEQVDRLVKQATSHENLCQGWTGWCAFW
jgi:FKBP12-rapamycin complex-associated protein